MSDRQVEIIYPTPYYISADGAGILGGGELTIHVFMKEFVKRGWKSTVFLVGRTLENKTYSVDGVNVIENSYISFKEAFKNYVESHKPSVGLISSIDAAQSNFFFDILKAASVHTITYEQFYRLAYNYFQNMLEIPIDHKRIPPEGKNIISNADVVMVNSDYTGLVIKRFLNRDSVIVYPPIDTDKVISTEHIRKYVTLVNPSLHKGREVFLSLARDFPATQFMVVEMPHDKAGSEFHLPNITILPFQSDVREIYKQTKVLLFPTLTDETFGRTMVEAMANGIPVIARDVGGIPFVLGREGAGILIHRDEPNTTWFRELQKLLENPDYYEEMSKKSFARHKHFNYQIEVDKVINIVESLVGHKDMSETTTSDDDNFIINKLDKMDVHDDFVNDDGTHIKLNNIAAVVGEKGEFDVISICPFFPSVRDILMNVTKEMGRHCKAKYADFNLPRSGTAAQQFLVATAQSIANINPKLLILGSWTPYYFPIIQQIKKSCQAKIAISWHSNFSQMELSPDREADVFIQLCGLLNTGQIDYVFMSDREDAELLHHTVHRNIHWLPDFLDLNEIRATQPVQLNKELFHVSLFAFPTARKNILAQVAGARAVKERHLHVNNFAPRNQQSFNYLRIMDALKLPYTHHGWMEKDQYYNLIAGMNAGLQVTFAETFSIVAAEHMALGIPCVVSTMVPVMRGAGLDDILIVKNSNSSKEIAAKLAYLRDNPDRAREIGQQCKTHIIGVNNMHKSLATDFLLKIIQQG